MKTNLNLGRVTGIKIQIHWTFLFLMVWIVFEALLRGDSTKSIVFNMAFILAIFGCVVLHELGHALMAKHFGIITKKITLLPIGGVASLEKIPEDPKQELLVAIAGPLVNVLIAFILYVTLPIKQITSLNFNEALIYFNAFTLQNFLFFIFIVNVGLFVFNLIPAFPMDGGRVFRALLAMKIDRVKATHIATTIGQIIAVFFLLIGLLYNPILIFIALFIFLAAYGENKYVHDFSLLKNHTVKEAMLTDITTFNSNNTINDVIEVLLTGSETNFIVIDQNDIKGVLYYEDLIKNSKQRDVLVKEVMKTTHEFMDVNMNLADAYKKIYSEKKSFLAVKDQNKFVGAIDLSNLNEFIILQAKLQF
jgi:Zn-dependent protease/predicted transcriptional regulator